MSVINTIGPNGGGGGGIPMELYTTVNLSGTIGGGGTYNTNLSYSFYSLCIVISTYGGWTAEALKINNNTDGFGAFINPGNKIVLKNTDGNGFNLGGMKLYVYKINLP